MQNRVSRKKETAAGGLPGVATLVVAFAILCIAVFSILALSTAKSEKKFSDAAVKNITDYYAAESAAVEKIAKMQEEGQTGECAFTVPVSDTRSLQVKADIQENGVEFKKFQLAYTADWYPDESLDVWGGFGEEE